MDREQMIEAVLAAFEEAESRASENGLWDSGSAQYGWRVLAEAAVDAILGEEKAVTSTTDAEASERTV